MSRSGGAVTQADIDAQLRKLDTTIGNVTPFNQGVGNCFDRNVEMDQTGRRLKPRHGKAAPLSYDSKIAALLTEIAATERNASRGESKTASAAPVPRGRNKGSGIKQIKGPHTKDHVGAMHKFTVDPAAIFTTASADAFRFTDDMRQELSEREITHCMKRDEFRDYTEALAKYKHMAGHKS